MDSNLPKQPVSDGQNIQPNNPLQPGYSVYPSTGKANPAEPLTPARAVTPAVPNVFQAGPQESSSIPREAVLPRRTAFSRTGVIVAVAAFLLTAAAGLWTVAGQNRPAGSSNLSRNYQVASVPLADLASQGLSLDGAGQLTVNGQLRINSSLVLKPSDAPSDPSPGQIYIDKATGQLYYHNGSGFLQVATAQSVAGLGNVSRTNAGSGLAVNGTSLVNTGVLSLQGQSGALTLTSGDGIAINGLSIANTGVLGLSGTSGQISVSSSSGNVVLTLPQNIDAAAAPTFSGLQLSSLTQNGVLYGGGGGVLNATSPGTAGQCLKSTGSAAPSFQNCTAGSGGVGVGSSQTAGRLTKFDTTANTITDSLVSELGTVITVGGGLSVSGTTAQSAQSIINASTATTIGQIIQGAASQTADLLQIQNSAGTTNYLTVSVTGATVTGDLTVSGIVRTNTLFTGSRAAGNDILNFTVPGETTSRFVSDISGKFNWGDGTNPRDTNLYRSATSTLKTDSNFVGAGTALFQNAVDFAAAFQIQNAAGTSNLFVANTANSIVGIAKIPSVGGAKLQVGGNFDATGSATLGADLTARNNTASQVKIGQVGPASEAGISFSSAGDTNLYRSAASTLKTDGALIVRGLVSQTADLLQLQDSAGIVLARVGSTGDIASQNDIGMLLGESSAASLGFYNLFKTNNAGRTAVVVRGAASQTADLLQLQNSAGTVLSKFDSNGNLTIVPVSGRATINLDTQTGNTSGPIISFKKQGTTEFSIYDYTGAAKLAFFDNSTSTDALFIQGGNTSITGILNANAGGKTAITIADSGAQSSGITIGGDTNLYRSAASTLKTDGSLTVGSNLTVQGPNIVFNNASAALIMQGAAAGTDQIFLGASGESAYRFRVSNSGLLSWGSGSAATDTNLYRNGVGKLQTDGKLYFNAATATNPTVGTYVTGDSFNRYSLQGGGTQEFGTGAAARDTQISRGPSGGITIKPISGQADQATAFQVQNAAGVQLINVDTTHPGNNLVTNGSFEVDTAGWAGKGSGTIARSTAQKYIGNASGLVTTTATAGDGASYAVTLSPSTQYTLSVFVRDNGSFGPNLSLGRQDVSGTDIDCLTGRNPSSSGFIRYNCTFTTGATITSSNIYVKQSDATARSFYIDAISLATGSGYVPYSEGAISLNGTVTSPLVIQGQADSTTAFQVQQLQNSNLSVFNVDSMNNTVSIGSTQAYTSAKLLVSTGSYPVIVANATGSNNLLQLQNNGSSVVTVASTGATTIKNSTNSTTAFQVQNAAGTTIMGIDTANAKIFSVIPNSATAIGFAFNTPAYATAGAKLLSVQNNNAEKFYIDKDGNVVVSGGITASGTTIMDTSGNSIFPQLSASAKKLIQSFTTAVVTSDTGGWCNFSYPTAFSAVPDSLVVAPDAGMFGNGGTGFFYADKMGSTTNFRVFINASNLGCVFNVIAVGNK